MHIGMLTEALSLQIKAVSITADWTRIYPYINIYKSIYIYPYLNSCKFLGLHCTYIDSKLSFKFHIDLIINKITRNTGISYKIRDNLPMKARINYYYSFIYPYLIYNVLTFGNTYECHLAKLITQQKIILRAIANSDFHYHTYPLFYRLKLLKFTDIYINITSHCIAER